MEPEYVECAFSNCTTRWRGSPLSTICALGILPLGFNSRLEAVKVSACAQLAWLQHIIVETANYNPKSSQELYKQLDFKTSNQHWYIRMECRSLYSGEGL